MNTLKCPECSAELRWDSSLTGQTVQCSRCDCRFQVPDLESGITTARALEAEPAELNLDQGAAFAEEVGIDLAETHITQFASERAADQQLTQWKRDMPPVVSAYQPSGVLPASALSIPPNVYTLPGFRRWAHSASLPEKVKVHFIRGQVCVDMSHESVQSHVLVKAGIFQTLLRLVDEADLGEFYPDGLLFTNKRAQISNHPDGVAILWPTFESGQVRFVTRKGNEIEIQGTPDWVMEIVSNGSVAKDKKQLRRAYHRAGIPEYWLIDARGSEVSFQILHWRRAAYVPVNNTDGWQHSRIFDHDFRLLRRRNRRGAWRYLLEARKPSK